MVDNERLKSRYETLKTSFAPRDSQFQKLHDYVQGNRLQDELESEDRKYVVNRLAQAIDDYMVLESNLPEIEVPPPLETVEARRFADKMEKTLWAIWQNNKPEKIMNSISWYKNLYGQVYLGAYPDTEKIMRYLIADPSNFYYTMSENDEDLFDEAFYVRKIRREIIRRYIKPSSENLSDDLDEQEVLYYWNKQEYAVIELEGSQFLGTPITHNWGFVPWVPLLNLYRPGLEGEATVGGDRVALNKYENELMSDLAEMIDYYANPITIGEGTHLHREDWESGPGAYNEIAKGGKVYNLEWKGNPPVVDNQIARTEKNFQDRTGMPPLMQGRVEHHLAGTSGKVITGLAGGIEMRITARQRRMARALSTLFEFTLRILEKRKNKIRVRGLEGGKRYLLELDPKEIQGYYMNIVHWLIGLWDYPSKVVTELQLVGAGIHSKFTAMQNLQVRSPVDELERVRKEKEEELKSQLAIQKAIQPPGPEKEVGEGAPGKEPEEEPKEEMPEGAEKLAEEALRAEKGATKRKKERGRPKKGTRPEAASAGRIELNEVSRGLANIKKLHGDVFLGGGLVSEGYTNRDIDLWLSDMSDKQSIINALPEFKGRFEFHALEGKEPKGAHLKILKEPKIR